MHGPGSRRSGSHDQIFHVRSLSAAIAVASLFAATACSNEVTDPGGEGGGGGGVTSSTTGEGGQAQGTGGEAGTGGQAQGTGGQAQGTGGGAAACEPGEVPGLTWGYTSWQGSTYEDGVTPEGVVSGDVLEALDAPGTVVLSEPGRIDIDFCSPAADCTPLVDSFTFATSEGPIDVAIPVGTHVSVRFDLVAAGYPPAQPPFLVERLELTNLEDFDGEANPTETGSRLWLSLGSYATDGRVSVDQGPSCDGSTPELSYYGWSLVLGLGGAEVELAEGESGSMDVASGIDAGAYAARNLESHADQIEGAFPSSYWVKRQ